MMPACDKCGEEYDNYHIILPNGFTTFIELEVVRDRYGDNLCPPCFNEVMSTDSYALDRFRDKQPIGRKKGEGDSDEH